MLYQHTSCKGSYSLIIKNVFIEFVGGTMSGTMHDECVIVDMLLFVGNNTTVTQAFRPFAGKGEVEQAFISQDGGGYGLSCRNGTLDRAVAGVEHAVFHGHAPAPLRHIKENDVLVGRLEDEDPFSLILRFPW